MSYTVIDTCPGDDGACEQIKRAQGRPDGFWSVIDMRGTDTVRYIATFDSKGNAEKVAELLNKYLGSSEDPDDAYLLAYNLSTALV